jgi:4-methylaminobutanoate oxidase (formaldehyde-forming)
VQLLVKDPEPMMFHGEIVLRDGMAVGEVRAASYGHTLGGAVGLAYIHGDPVADETFIRTGKWEVDIAGKRYPAELSFKPMYDPAMEKVKS